MTKRIAVTLVSVILAIGLLSTLTDAGIRLVSKEVHMGKVERSAGQENIVQPGMNDVNPADFLAPEELGKYSWIMSGTPVLSPDKKRMVYVATRDGSTFAVVDGVEQKAYYDIGRTPIFSPDSKRVAYAAVLEDKWVIVVDGVQGEKCDEITEGLTFSSDSRQIAYAAGRDGKQFAVVNGVEQREYRRVHWVKFSPNGKRLAYEALKSNGKYIIVVDEAEGIEHNRVANHTFSPDSKRIAYIARHDNKWTVVVDGVQGKERYDRIHNIVFSPDSERLAYIGVRNDRDFVGLTGETFRLKRGDQMITVLMDEPQGKGQCDRIYGLVFSPDSKRLAYAAIRDGRHFAVVDGIEQEKYDGIGMPAFSPDSKHIVYSAKHEAKWLLVVDGVEGAEYDNLLENVSFGTLDWMIRFPRTVIFDPENPAKFYVPMVRDQNILRLEVEIVEEAY